MTKSSPRKKPSFSPLPKGARWLTATLSWCAVWYVCFTFIVNYAHDYGYLIADTGWQTALLWRNDLSLSNPPMVPDNVRFGADSFYQIHLAFLLAPFTWLSHFLPFTAEEWLAMFTASGIAILAAIFTLAIGVFLRMETPNLRPLPTMVLATVAGFILSLNPIIGNILIYPHFELWIPVLLICLLFALGSGRLKTAAVILLPLLLTREDAGLHLCMILWTAAIWRAVILRRQGETWPRTLAAQKHLLMWSIPALVYSLICLLTPGWGRALPEVDVLELSTLLNRWSAIIWRLEWTAPFAVLIIAAVIWRRWSWLLGLVSCLPWVIYNSTQGGSGFAGDLQLYYSFPLIVALFWPFIAHQFIPEKGRKLGLMAALFVIVFAAATIIRPYSDTLSTRNSLRTLVLVSGGMPSAEKREALDLAGDFLASHAERLIVADSFSVLRPHDVAHDRFLPLDDGDLNVCHGDFMFVNTTYFDNLRRNAMGAALAFNLRHQYHLRHTSYRLFSSRPLCEDAANHNACAGHMPLRPIPMDDLRQDLAARFGSQGMTWRGCVLRQHQSGQISEHDGLVLPASATGVVAELLDVPLPAGQYALDIIYRHETTEQSLLLEINNGTDVLSRGYLPSNPDPKKGARIFFNLPTATAVNIGFGKTSNSEFDLRKISLHPAGAVK